MSQTNMIGIVLLAVGAALLFFASRAARAPLSQMSEALTARFTGNTMWCLLGRIVAVVAGECLLFRGYSRK